MPVFVEGNHIYFSLLLQLEKTSTNSYPSLRLVINSCVKSFQILKVQAKLAFTLLTIGKEA